MELKEIEETNHHCLIPLTYKDNYQVTCSEIIKGKVLSVEIVKNKQENEEFSYEIKINKPVVNIMFEPEFVVFYGLTTYGIRPKPKKGSTYYFFLHKVKNGRQKR